MNDLLLKTPNLLKKEAGKSLDTHAKKDLVLLVYKTILEQLDQRSRIHLFQSLIKKMPEHEIDMEWKAIEDGTVSSALRSLLSGKMDRSDLEHLGALYNGIAVPYFKDYNGKVPKEDMEWAHSQIKEFFDQVDTKIKTLPVEKEKLKIEGFVSKVKDYYAIVVK